MTESREEFEARVRSEDRAMLLDPARWPGNPVLCLKSRPPYTEQQFGIITESAVKMGCWGVAVYAADMRSLLPDPRGYPTADALLDEWTVD